MSGFLIPNDSHKQNSAAAIRGEKASGPAKYQFPVMRDVILRKDGVGGSWQVYIGNGNPLPASPVEVALWLENQKLKGLIS
jgi:hypothetical protein